MCGLPPICQEIDTAMRRSHFVTLIVFLGLLSLNACDSQQASAPQGDNQVVVNLLKQMTLEQKVGQMLQGEIKHVTPRRCA